METTALSKTRNIGIVAHIDAGKTTMPVHFLCYEFKGCDLFRLEEVNPTTGATIA